MEVHINKLYPIELFSELHPQLVGREVRYYYRNLATRDMEVLPCTKIGSHSLLYAFCPLTEKPKEKKTKVYYSPYNPLSSILTPFRVQTKEECEVYIKDYTIGKLVPAKVTVEWEE